ncbi:hypothetical protein Tsubulata_015846 [Turnera subulata]|uniref:RING-type domain-containing protein n=1 Tax=Turnera subulata TaxID=218843 RepID=A0A9Q0GGQ0_9ROSI|nr:hypothetical protein Tsubulata_015846 [Turnera subulata]
MEQELIQAKIDNIRARIGYRFSEQDVDRALLLNKNDTRSATNYLLQNDVVKGRTSTGGVRLSAGFGGGGSVSEEEDAVVAAEVEVEVGEFPVEKDWFLVGGTVVTALSTTKGRKLVDNEIVHFTFSKFGSRRHSQYIVRFSTSRFREIGRLPMEWGRCIELLLNHKMVKLYGRCVAAPENLQMMQDVLLYVSCYIHRSVLTQLADPSNNFYWMTFSLLDLFKLLNIKPYQGAEYNPSENSRKRPLGLNGDPDEVAAILPLAKRRVGGQAEQDKDEQAITQSALDKIIGSADNYDIEEMEPPSTLISKLKMYQKQALYWMSEAEEGNFDERAEKTLHPCWSAYRLSDKPGFGNIDSKQSIDTLPKARGCTLIICPMALLGQWKDELQTHSEGGSLSIFVHYGGYRTHDPTVFCNYDVVLTTYGVLSETFKHGLEHSIFHQIEWHRVVLDEAHTIKSWKTLGAKACFALSSQCRWCLTGTPIQNNLEDLYSLLCFLHVEPWCEWQRWYDYIQKPYEDGDPRGLKLIKGVLKEVMLRRTKETKDHEGRPILILPPTDIQIIKCKQSEAERDFYDALFNRSKARFDELVTHGKVLKGYATVLELLLRLRQCCNHPFLVISRTDLQDYPEFNRLAKKFVETDVDTATASDSDANPEEIEEVVEAIRTANSAARGQSVTTQAYIEEVVGAIRRGETTECPICMESSDDPVLTPCAHRMCKECLLYCWGNPTSGLCPICRTSLDHNDLISFPTESKFQLDVEEDWKDSSKVSELMRCLERIHLSDSGEKSIVFTQWTSFLDLLEIPLKRKGIEFLRYDGQLAQKQREKILKEFNKTSEKMVLLMSLKAGGVGLNLTAASNVFLMDPWWNPALEEQAIMRIHRIGQERTVCVRRFIVEDSIEDRLQQVLAKKQRMIAGALTDEEVRSSRIEELKVLFKHQQPYMA